MHTGSVRTCATHKVKRLGVPRCPTPWHASIAQIATISTNNVRDAAIQYHDVRDTETMRAWDSWGMALASIKGLKIGGGSRKTPARRTAADTEKELQRLRRVDLLELLLDEIRQNEQDTAKLEELTELVDRLKAKLDDKDEQIEHLKRRLDGKDQKIAELEARAARLAEANGMMTDPRELAEIERRALEQYFNLKATKPRHAGQSW